MAIHKVNFAPSKAMYAFAWDYFTRDQHGFTSVAAIWIKRKKGVLVLSEGFVGGMGNPPYADPRDFMARFDGRYGGWPSFTWDGTYMNARETPLAEMVEAAERLTPVLENLPEVPEGYEGWYALS